MRILRDPEISAFISETKLLPENWQSLFTLKEKSGFQHKERSIMVLGKSGSQFRVILRQNRINTFDFSVILIFQDKDGKEYRLVRYNGKHPSEHTNKWEKEQGQTGHTFGPEFHMHFATERYQEAGYSIDGFAKVTTEYHDFRSALERFFRDNNFRQPETPQRNLFEGGESI